MSISLGCFVFLPFDAVDEKYIQSSQTRLGYCYTDIQIKSLTKLQRLNDLTEKSCLQWALKDQADKKQNT